jgi:hypothetical protein
MWALVENNQITQVYTKPKAITIGDNQYPSNIMSVWSAEELEAIGIYEVVVDNSNFKNPSYYINTNQSFDFANDVVTASYGTATPKAIDDVTDDDGNVTRGLKYNHKQVINQQAGGMLSNTDWYVIRETDGGTAVPSDITTHRAAIRTKANDMCTLIDGAADVDALAALYEYTNTGTEEEPVYTRPLGEFPILDV